MQRSGVRGRRAVRVQDHRTQHMHGSQRHGMCGVLIRRMWSVPYGHRGIIILRNKLVMCMVSSVVRGHAHEREQRRGPGHEVLGASAVRLGLGPSLYRAGIRVTVRLRVRVGDADGKWRARGLRA